jgi:type VI secretion system protein ImpA
VIKFEQLMQEISPETPSGEQDLAYDPAFLELEKNLIESPEIKNEKGEIVKKAVIPEWEEAGNLAIEILSRAHDLRVAVHLTRILLHTENLQGLEQGLQLIYGYIDQYWETCYPQLDPEDDNDPTERVNILADLNDYQTIISPIVNKIVLCSLPGLGTVRLADIRAAEKDPEAKPSRLDIDSICTGNEIETLQATLTAAQKCSNWLEQCNTSIIEKVGQINATKLDNLHQVLTEIIQFFTQQLTRLQPGEAIMEDDSTSASQPAGGKAETCLTQGITCRSDVLRTLEKICRYYESHEPSSPVPLLLQRAHGLVEKNFVDIIEDLAPDSLSQIRKIL